MLHLCVKTEWLKQKTTTSASAPTTSPPQPTTTTAKIASQDLVK